MGALIVEGCVVLGIVIAIVGVGMFGKVITTKPTELTCVTALIALIVGTGGIMLACTALTLV